MARRVHSRLFLGVLLAASGFSFAPAPVYREPVRSKAPHILALMQGTWTVERDINLRNNGPGDFHEICIRGTTWTHDIIINGPSMVLEPTKYRIVVDPEANPATLDLELADFIPGGVMKGIVKVEGETLTFCYADVNQKNAERPKHFAVGDRRKAVGPSTITMTLNRIE